MSIPLWPPCTHPLMATSTRIMHHVTKFKIISNWFLEHDNDFTVQKWPPQSPDLNPIEHLWDVVERELRALDVHPHQLQDAILSIWAYISKECFLHLVEVIELGVIQSPTPLELFLGKLLWFLTANLFVMPPASYQYQCSLSPAV